MAFSTSEIRFIVDNKMPLNFKFNNERVQVFSNLSKTPHRTFPLAPPLCKYLTHGMNDPKTECPKFLVRDTHVSNLTDYFDGEE